MTCGHSLATLLLFKPVKLPDSSILYSLKENQFHCQIQRRRRSLWILEPTEDLSRAHDAEYDSIWLRKIRDNYLSSSLSSPLSVILGNHMNPCSRFISNATDAIIKIQGNGEWFVCKIVKV